MSRRSDGLCDAAEQLPDWCEEHWVSLRTEMAGGASTWASPSDKAGWASPVRKCQVLKQEQRDLGTKIKLNQMVETCSTPLFIWLEPTGATM